MFLNFLNKNRNNVLLLLALFLYNALFYSERLGINLLLFSLVIFVFQFILFRESFKSRTVLISIGLCLFTLVMVVWHNSLLSKWMFFITYSVSLGSILQPELRFAGYSMLTAIFNYLRPPFEIFNWNSPADMKAGHRIKLSKIFILSGLPIAIVIIFYLIYRAANPVFAEVTDKIFENIADWVNNFFKYISILRILFILSGVLVLSGILYSRRINLFVKEESQLNDDISRKRRFVRWPFLKLDLKNEYMSGILLLVLMNLLLLGLNIIDIKYIWINFHIPEGISLSEMVHQGTEWLIVSIILSMIVVIYILRANLNFYSKNSLLKILAYVWMMQNMILTISLLIRNNTYVSWHALAYKRLGVYVFIALTFIGLFTMLIKIYKAKSFFYLLRVNFWAALIILTSVTCINWDIFIAKYNVEFTKGAQLDTDFLLKLSPKSYPYILDSMEKVAKQIEAHDSTGQVLQYSSREYFEEQLHRQSLIYIDEHKSSSWRSFNFADDYALAYLKNKYNY